MKSLENRKVNEINRTVTHKDFTEEEKNSMNK